jgi:hypothetical protein
MRTAISLASTFKGRQVYGFFGTMQRLLFKQKNNFSALRALTIAKRLKIRLTENKSAAYRANWAKIIVELLKKSTVQK